MEDPMHRIILSLAAYTAAGMVGFQSPASADDRAGWNQPYGYHMHNPGWHMGPGYGMGPGQGSGMGQGYGMAPGYGMRGQQPGMRQFRNRASVDTNDDGIVSNAEAARHFEDAFMTMDADDDGHLTKEEFFAIRFGSGPAQSRASGVNNRWKERKQKRFAEMDENKDGKITQAEFLAHGKRRFDDADRDKDGKVTAWEFRARRHF
jgi:Ca2+-binding EF-hand superfamily protein